MKKMSVFSGEEIFHWYNIIQDFLASGLSPKYYCVQNNVDFNIFRNMRSKMLFDKLGNPEKNKKYLHFAQLFYEQPENQSTTVKAFAKANDLKYIDFQLACLHKKYMGIVNKFLENKPPALKTKEDISFIPIAAASGNNKIISAQHSHELIKAKNDIELIIRKGIRVIVSPEIGAESLIKIIELLKDM